MLGSPLPWLFHLFVCCMFTFLWRSVFSTDTLRGGKSLRLLRLHSFILGVCVGLWFGRGGVGVLLGFIFFPKLVTEE